MKTEFPYFSPFKVARLVVMATALGTVASAYPLDITFNVSGSPGDWLLDFTFQNNMPVSQSLYFWGIELADSTISGSPTNWTPDGTFDPAPFGGPDVTFDNLWYAGGGFVLPGQSLSGFQVTDTDATAPSEVLWLAYFTGSGSYTGTDYFSSPNNPGFSNASTPTAAPEPNTLLLLGAALGICGVMTWLKRGQPVSWAIWHAVKCNRRRISLHARFLTAVGIAFAAAVATPARASLITSPGSGTVVPNFGDFGTPAATSYTGTPNLPSGASADGITITNDANAGFFLTIQQFGWAGDFGHNAIVLWGSTPRDTFTFAAATSSFGVQYDPDGPPNSNFSAQIDAYDHSGNLLETVTENGFFAGANYTSDVAMFIGIQRASADIAKVVVSGSTSDFALSGGTGSNVSSTPEPSSFALAGLGVLAAILLLRRRLSNPAE